MQKYVSILYVSIILLTHAACSPPNTSQQNESSPGGQSNSAPVARMLPDSFKDYYYSGEAEISVYNLSQARYGELRKGQASLIFVTEPFNPTKLVKSDNASEKDVSVLKLNFTRKFNTGIYPYSTMVSTFVPVGEESHALKVSTSVQEWCGQIYSELRNSQEDHYKVDLYSYFEGETETGVSLKKNILENEIWNLMKLNPAELPVGDLRVVPSFLYLRLMHQPMKAYNAVGKKQSEGDTSSYILYYPELERTLTIDFQTAFPYQIYSWKDSYPSGFGKARKMLTTTAQLKATYKGAYWNKNTNADSTLRGLLQLNKL